MTKDSAVFLNNEFEQRKRAGKEATTIIVSGKQLSEEKIKRALRRHVPPKWKPDPVPNSPGTGGQLIVCTPPEMSACETWKDWPQTPRPLPFISFSMLARTLNISVGSVVLAGSQRWTTSIGHMVSQLSQLSTPKAAVALDRFIPETFPGDNMRLAAALTCPRATIDHEVLKLIIFWLSNNFFRWYDRDDSKGIMELCNILGLAKPAIINELFRLAPNQPSILAAIHALFMAACETESGNLISTMIQCDKNMHNGTHAYIKPSHLTRTLKMALKSKNLDLIEVLLSPASHRIIQEVLQSWDLHEGQTHLFFDESELTTTIVRMFLSSGIKFPGDQLLNAIRAGNLEVFNLLVDHHVDLDHKTTGNIQILFTDRKNILYPYIKVDALNTAVAAVTYTCHECKPRQVYRNEFDIGFQGRCHNCEARAMKMLHEVRLRKGIAVNDVSVAPLNMLIIAAARGFNEIICTFAGGHETLSKANKHGLWPLGAAVTFNNLDTCRLLLQMGASPNFRPPTSDD